MNAGEGWGKGWGGGSTARPEFPGTGSIANVLYLIIDFMFDENIFYKVLTLASHTHTHLFLSLLQTRVC